MNGRFRFRVSGFRFWVFGFGVLLTGAVFAQSAEELLARVDKNEVYNSISAEAKMIIEYQGRRYVKEMTMKARGSADSFVEFTNPEDKGTKYLKTGPRLYVYSPDTEKVMLISGHMLKESMMGSDLSYEDTVNNDTLSSRYNAVISNSETFNSALNAGGTECWVLELTAKNKTESYPKQKLWIDKKTGDMIHTEQYALSGAKLKEFSLIKVESIGGRRFPVEYEMRDMLRKGSKTTFVMSKVELDKSIQDSVFSQQNLK